jgi:hypothetical protein
VREYLDKVTISFTGQPSELERHRFNSQKLRWAKAGPFSNVPPPAG